MIDSTKQRACSRFAARGMTLMELMVVVVIMGILAMIASSSFRAEMNRSESTEGLAIARGLDIAQKSYRGIHGTYLNVSASGNFYPAGAPGFDTANSARATTTFYGHPGHPDAANWTALAAEVPSLISYRFRVRAGLPGAANPGFHALAEAVPWPNPTTDWYVVEALGDVDGDGDQSLIVLTSFTNTVAQYNHGE